MALSAYNKIHERILAAELDQNELRLAIAFTRCLLGWKRNGGIPNEGRLGRAHLMATARISDKRTFARAFTTLENVGLIEVLERGARGRGNRALYRLVLDPVKAAPARHFPEQVKAAPVRPLDADGKGRSGNTEKAAPARLRKGDGKGKPPAALEKSELVRRAFDAYVGAGGSVSLDDRRGALARNVAGLVKAGVDEPVILAACRELGRGNEFPGYLRQRAEKIAADGGPCAWNGLDRMSLTAAQLAECPCPHCTQWLGFRSDAAAVPDATPAAT